MRWKGKDWQEELFKAIGEDNYNAIVHEVLDFVTKCRVPAADSATLFINLGAFLTLEKNRVSVQVGLS